MTNIANRIKALGLLRWIYLISLVIASASFILIFIALALGSEYQFTEPGGVTYYVLTLILSIAHFVVIVLIAATFILTFRLNIECRISFFIGIGAAVLSIASGIMVVVPVAAYAGLIIAMISDLLITAALFALIDGIFEKQARGTPLFNFAMLGMCLNVVYTVFSFVASVFRLNEAFSAVLYTIGAVCYILSSLIIFMSLNSSLKEIKRYQESEA